MNKTVEIVRESRTDQKMSEENGRWGMRSGCKLKGYQFFREIVMFFRKCHSFLLLINSFNFDGKMVRNVGDFLPINIRSLTKHTFGCNSPIIANRGSSPVTLKKNSIYLKFWGFSKTLWNWILDLVFCKVPLENSLPERAEVQNYVHPPFRPHLWWPQMERPD